MTNPEQRSIADYPIKYTFPDEVDPNGQLQVQVSITYTKNSNAKLAWMEFFDIQFQTRIQPNGTDLTSSEIDSSKRRLAPGEEYSKLFFLKAPSNPSVYYVVLIFKISNPQTEAYGRTINAFENKIDVGRGTLLPLSKAKLTVRNPTSAPTSASTSTPTSRPTSTSSFNPLLIAGIAAIAAAAIIAAILLMKRRRPSAASVVPAPMPSQTVPSAPAVKYCMNCGSSIPEIAKHCTKCGTAQQ